MGYSPQGCIESDMTEHSHPIFAEEGSGAQRDEVTSPRSHSGVAGRDKLEPGNLLILSVGCLS